MSGGSSSAAWWSSRLEPVRPDETPRRPDDPRLGERAEFWQEGVPALKPGRAVLVGFPEDEGIRRNLGRPGAAEAPTEIRRWLYRLTPWHGLSDTDLTLNPPLDAGNVMITGDLETAHAAMAEVVGGVLATGAVPVVLGGGHETAYGHFLGYVAARKNVAIINFDAHLDVRPCLGSLGHSGSPFRQALEYVSEPQGESASPGGHGQPKLRYVCLGAQPAAVSREHWEYVQQHGGSVLW